VLNNEIAEIVRAWSGDSQCRAVLVQRPHTGKARCAQVRNNAVRALQILAERGEAKLVGSRLVFLDGDTVAPPSTLELHGQAGPNEIVSAYRVNLTQSQTEQFSQRPEAGLDTIVAPEQLDELARRDARYRRQDCLRRFWLGKDHKPRLIGGHFSVPYDAYVGVNGVDEEYEGYGQEDDDFTRRLYKFGCSACVQVRTIPVFHLYHPTRAPAAWETAPGVARFREKTPTRAVRGLDSPLTQGEVHAFVMVDGVIEDRFVVATSNDLVASSELARQ
jgi:hypothetical protein